MPDPLDYRPLADDARPPVTTAATDVAIVATVAEHVLAFLLFGGTLDGGMALKTCLIVAVAFWALVALLVARRRGRLTGVADRLFVGLGYPAMLVPCLIARGEF